MRFRNILVSFPIILILILTLLLLEFIGYGEAKRNYTQFQLARLATQGEIIKNGFDSYLQAGLPLKQFSGFASQSRTLLLSDDSIQTIQIIDNKNNIVFPNEQSSFPEQKKLDHYPLSDNFKLEGNIKVEESIKSFRVILPLDTRFGLVGYVIIESEKEALLQILNEKFDVVFYYVVPILSVIFILLITIYETYFSDKKTRERFLKIAYIIEFIIMSIIISVVIFQIYEHGARASTKALSNSMSQRLSAILKLGIHIEDISQINQTFKDYKQNNPQINQIALTRDNIVIFHTDEKEIGQPYHLLAPTDFESATELTGSQENQVFRVSVTIPINVVMNAILGSAKAFIVLFVACGLISFIFLDAGTALLTIRGRHEQITPSDSLVISSHSQRDENTRFQMGLRLVKPAYFLIVFVNALSVSFLPQLATDMAKQSGSAWATASLPFSIFYMWFALVLIPAGYYAEKGNLKKLMAFGFIAEVIGLTLIALTGNFWIFKDFWVFEDFWVLTISRIFSGMGQGAFLIGLQSYILVVTPKGKQTEGGAVKVTGRNAGMIAGTSIGALLFVYLSPHVLFMIASIVTLLASIYLWALVPDIEEITDHSVNDNSQESDKKPKKLSSLRKVQRTFLVFKDFEFLNTLIFIGLISKIAIAGVVMFAVPLVLSNRGFASEDIGLGLMLFYISSMMTTHYISRWVDHLGQTRWVLSMSSWVGGIAILLFGLLGVTTGQDFLGIHWLNSLANSFKQIIQIITGLGLPHFGDHLVFFFLVLAGISNGLSTAPLLTHINKTEVAEKQGYKSVSAIYTFLERGGHILGPMMIGQLLAFGHQNTLGLTLFGIMMVFSGFLFQILSRNK